jgi:hypothetical protein
LFDEDQLDAFWIQEGWKWTDVRHFPCHWMHRYGELQASRRSARRKSVISGFFEE